MRAFKDDFISSPATQKPPPLKRGFLTPRYRPPLPQQTPGAARQKTGGPQKPGGDQKKDEQKPKPGEDQPAAPSPTPGEKKEGDLKANNPQDQQPAKPEENKPEGQAAAGEEEEKDGEMSAAQARGLLNSLRSEEEKVNLMQQQTSQDVSRDW